MSAKELKKEKIGIVTPKMSTRALRKERIGIVASNKMNKSVVISEVRKVKHPVYGKFVLKTKRYVAHDEKDECNEGDTVKGWLSEKDVDTIIKKMYTITGKEPEQV